MEEKPSLSSAMFAGTRFDRKRFAGDIARSSAPAAPNAAAPGPEKKRKRKSKSKANAKKIKRKKKRADGAASAPGESSGFSVFKGAEAKEAVEEPVEVVVREGEDEAVVRRRKEAEREMEGHLSVIEKHSLNGHNDIVRDFITTGCKLSGLPLYQKNLYGDSTYPIDCRDNPKYLHVVGQIYKPFMIYVQDQTGQVPVLVKSKFAEILFSNINADDVCECYKSRHYMLVDTCDSGQSSTCGMLDGSGKTCIAKRKRTKHKLDFHLIWLIVMKCLLNQGKNSPFCFQISVNLGRNVEDGQFELISLTMPIP
ncbi:DEAD-box ATP-dependent RNA helicase 57 [Hordeum vulgare]|nr:DEAD-box ATP-dependent RNA helicase 57 [Hordeum vulgare]